MYTYHRQEHDQLFDSITIENGTLNPPCAEGAPLPLWDAGAEIQDREKLKLSARQWTDPNKTTENDKPPYQHTGKGPCKTEKRYPKNRRRKGTEQATRKEEKCGEEVKDGGWKGVSMCSPTNARHSSS